MIDSNETLMYENGRDVGYSQGYEDGLTSKIEIIKPHPTEVIVIYFNFDDVDLNTMRDIFDSVVNKFPNNTVIAMPDKVSLESCSKDFLENYISMIAEIIEQL